MLVPSCLRENGDLVFDEEVDERKKEIEKVFLVTYLIHYSTHSQIFF